MSKRYFIGLDNGGSVTKAGLFDQNGIEIAVSCQLAQPITPRVGYVERDSTRLFEANLACLRDVIQKSGVDAADIQALSVTGHGNGMYLVGFDGKPSANGIISTDTRAAGQVKRLYETGEIHRLIGHHQSKRMGRAGCAAVGMVFGASERGARQVSICVYMRRFHSVLSHRQSAGRDHKHIRCQSHESGHKRV